jgi:hypothetical protein
MLSLTAFADQLEREKARQRTYDAMLRKAKAGHVTGGACFGYRNVDVVGPDGKRSHVERRINDTEAAIIRRIFQLSADGHGVKAIAKALNAERAPPGRSRDAHRPGRRRPSARCCSEIFIVVSSHGIGPANGLNGDNISRPRDRPETGSKCQRRTCRLLTTSCGVRHTPESTQRGHSICGARRAGRLDGRRMELRQSIS